MGATGQGLARADPWGSGARADPQCRLHRESSGPDPRDGRPGARRGWRQENQRAQATSVGGYAGVAAPRLLGHVTPHDFPRLSMILADQKYPTQALDAWRAEHRAGGHIEVKRRPAGTKGFTPLEKRWVMERTHAWHGRSRRNSKDYECSVESSTVMIKISHRHLMLNRLYACGRPEFHYR